MSKLTSKDILNRLNGGKTHVKKITRGDIKKMNIDLSKKKYDIDDVVEGSNVELEHTDVTKGKIKPTAKIAIAHLNENPHYYDLLSRMENPKNEQQIMNMKGGLISEAVRPKSVKSISNDVIDAINKVVHDTYNAEIYGSYVYRGQYFPGDIDLQEVITTTPKNRNQIFVETKNMIVKMVKDADDYPNVFFSEVKAGYDLRYSLIILSRDFPQKINNLWNHNLLTDDEYKKWGTLYNQYFKSGKKDIEAFAELEEEIRLRRVIRWNKSEILKGYKYLPGRYKITLIDALQIPSQIKIDIFVWIYGRFIEMTNFFYLVSYDKQQKKIEMINYDRENYALALVSQILKYQSKLFYNPFKMAKRMWGLARELDMSKIFNKLMPLFQGRTARMNQMRGEMKTIIDMYQKFDKLPYDKISKQLMGFKFRMSFLYNIDGFDEDKLLTLIDRMIEKVDQKKYIIKSLTYLVDEFTHYINSKSLHFLKKNNLLPVPKSLFVKAHKQPQKYIIDSDFFKNALGYKNIQTPSKELERIRHEKYYKDPFGEVIPIVDPNLNKVVQDMVYFDN